MGFRDLDTDGEKSVRDVEWDEVLVYRLTMLLVVKYRGIATRCNLD